MCVIALVTKEEARPTKAEIEQMWARNSDGGGAAWYLNGKVRWRKGLSRDKMVAMNAHLPTPYVLHFRLASAGGNSRDLCHPFPLDVTASVRRKGDTEQGVVFHNGHTSGWARLGTPQGVGGPWSDTRLLVWQHEGIKDRARMSVELGKEAPGQRFIVMTPERIFKVGGFEELHPGLFVSNLHWRSATEDKKWWHEKDDDKWWEKYAKTAESDEDELARLRTQYTDQSPSVGPPTVCLTAKAEAEKMDLVPVPKQAPVSGVVRTCSICGKDIQGVRMVTTKIGHEYKYKHIECWYAAHNNPPEARSRATDAGLVEAN